MKKIFLLFMILGLSFMSFVDTQASTHDTIDGITLSTQLQDLNNNTLVDVFESTNNYIDNTTYTWNQYGAGSATYSYTQNNEYFLSYEIKCTSSQFVGSYGGTRIFWNTGTVVYGVKDTNELKNELWNPQYTSFIAPTTQSIYIQFYCSSYTGSTLSIRNVIIVDLTYFGIQQDFYKIHYYYRVYKQLKAQITSYDNGYDDGESDGLITGYNDGYNDGLVEGYFNGQTDYYYGTYLTQLPGETSTPYNDGQVDGYQFGYDDGYNAGVTEELDTNYLLSFVQGSIAVLGAPILPNITLGVFVFVPLFFGFIAFLFRLGGKRG